MSVLALPGLVTPAFADSSDPLAPPLNAYGKTFADTYKTNLSANTTPETNAGDALLSDFSTIWTPGTLWNNGTVVDQAVQDSNIAQSIAITSGRTAAQGIEAYLYDRRNQSYSALDGFGPYTAAVRTAMNAKTAIPDVVPADATTVKYDDTASPWADTTSSLGKVVQLVNTLRGSYSSANPAKGYYKYPRPWRQSTSVVVLPSLVPAEAADPSNDGGFPSGHTNAAYLASIALANAYPERYQQLLTGASEMGHSRIVAGMHSPLDVIGGRILGTALAASILNDPDNAQLVADAHTQAEAVLATATPADTDAYGDYAANRAAYRQRLTYGFSQEGSTTVKATVPKGAEALLRTRFPYLTDTQLREVLRTTALPSGYPMLDDPEGWGRLDLFSAANGYGALDSAVSVSLDASKSSFAAADTWRNDLSGAGSLALSGTGKLTLTGTNTYSGGTEVKGGSLVAAGASALGSGSVITDDDATLAETASAPVEVHGDLTQADDATLAVSVDGPAAPVAVTGKATLAGTLKVSFAHGVTVADDVTLLTAGSIQDGSRFASVVIDGLPKGYQPALKYAAGSLHLVDATKEPAPYPVLAHSGSVTVVGAVRVGGTLSASEGSWPKGTRLGFTWLSDGTPIAGAESRTLVLAAGQLGHRISVTVTGYRDGYVSTSASSTPTQAVARGKLATTVPVVSGKARVGNVLKAKTSGWTPGTKLAYSWRINGKAVAGATGSSYRLRASNAGKLVSVRVTGTKSGYTTSSRDSRSVRVRR